MADELTGIRPTSTDMMAAAADFDPENVAIATESMRFGQGPSREYFKSPGQPSQWFYEDLSYLNG